MTDRRSSQQTERVRMSYDDALAQLHHEGGEQAAVAFSLQVAAAMASKRHEGQILAEYTNEERKRIRAQARLLALLDGIVYPAAFVQVLQIWNTNRQSACPVCRTTGKRFLPFTAPPPWRASPDVKVGQMLARRRHVEGVSRAAFIPELAYAFPIAQGQHLRQVQEEKGDEAILRLVTENEIICSTGGVNTLFVSAKAA